MKGKMRLSVKSEVDESESSEGWIVNRGTCHARIGAGGARAGNSLRLIVFASSDATLGSILRKTRREGKHTYGYHAFAIIVKIFQDHLTESIHFLPCATLHE